MPASNDIGAQVGYLDLADGGVGVLWIGRLTQSADPVLDSQLRYFFQGLTGDGQRLIVAMVPVTTGVLPADISAVPAEQMDMSASDYEAYMVEVQNQLNALAPGDFTATLDALDAMMQSVTVSQYANPLLPDALANLEYFSTLAPEGKVQLTDGQYEDAANSIYVSFVAQPIAYGILNEQSAAAVLIAENGGGSGTFVNLEVVLEQDEAATTVASVQLGDRVSVNQLTIANNQITVDMVTQGPNDPMCCPTQQVTQVYELQGDQLVLVSETKAEATAASPLAGTSWVWTGTTQNDAAITTPAQPDAFVVTFNADGTLSAQTDCNTRLGAYSEGANFGLTITMTISTMMACPPESQEEIFAEQLGKTLSYVLIDGKLSLAIGDGAFMEFIPATTAEQPAETAATTDASLTANPWNWTRTAMNDDSVKAPTQAGAFVLTLGADGSASTTTDCNTFNGTYTTGENNSITIALPVSTRMGCPDGAQEEAYIKDLTSVQSYLLQDGNLFLMLPFDSGTIDFAPAQ
jgi:heat shock protein HslJ